MTKEQKKQADRRYYLKNRDKLINKSKDWYQEHKEEKKEYARQYKINRQRNNLELYRKKSREYECNKRSTSLSYKIAGNLRNRLNQALRFGNKAGSAVDDLGCSIQELKLYIQARFKEGMSWENWGKFGWHIDHIEPLSSFDLTNREHFLKACHYTNLQPLWWRDNLVKAKDWYRSSDR